MAEILTRNESFWPVVGGYNNFVRFHISWSVRIITHIYKDVLYLNMGHWFNWINYQSNSWMNVSSGAYSEHPWHHANIIFCAFSRNVQILNNLFFLCWFVHEIGSIDHRQNFRKGRNKNTSTDDPAIFARPFIYRSLERYYPRNETSQIPYLLKYHLRLKKINNVHGKNNIIYICIYTHLQFNQSLKNYTSCLR